MSPSPDHPQLRNLLNIAIKFFCGAAIGCMLALLPLSYVWDFASNITILHILILIGFGLLGGILGAINTAERIMRFFESIAWF
jgi:hypothetical protein